MCRSVVVEVQRNRFKLSREALFAGVARVQEISKSSASTAYLLYLFEHEVMALLDSPIWRRQKEIGRRCTQWKTP
jgi:hypothetical protein